MPKPAEERPHTTSTQSTGEHPHTNGGSLRAEQANERQIGEHNRLLHEHRDFKTKHEELEVQHERLREARRQLETEKQTAIDEIAALRKTLTERDQALLVQRAQHDIALEAERLARDHAEQIYRESLCRAQEEHRSAEASRKHLQVQCIEMAAALEKLKCDHQLQLEAEHTKQRALTAELFKLQADSEETSRLASQLIALKMTPAQQNPAPDPKLEAVRAHFDGLTQWLAVSERVNREMAELLDGIGSQVGVPTRN